MDFAAPLVTTSEIADERSYDVVLNPVKTLDAASEMVGVSASVLNPVKTLPMTSEGTTLSSANFPAPLLMLSLNAEARLSAVLRNPVKALVTLSDIVDTEFSEIARAPVNIRPMTSEGTRLTSGNFPAPLLIESAIETTSDRDLATPLFTTSEIVDARFSDVVLNPVKALDVASEMMGASAIPRPNPVKNLTIVSDTVVLSVSPLNVPKSLLVVSEIGGASDRDFPTFLLTESAIAEARLSDVLRNPVKALITLSDTADTESSEIARAPVNIRSTTSEGTTLSSGNFPAPFLTESAIETTSDRDFETPLFTTPEIADARLSDVVLNPVKSLPTTSEGTTLSSGNFPAPFLTESAIETTSDMDLATPLFTTPEIADARLSDVVLNPVKTLSAASETLGVSESVLNPVKTLPTTSEGTTLRSGNFPAPLLTEAAIAEARLSDVLRNPVKTLSRASDTAATEFSEIARAPVKTLLATSEGTRVSSGNFPTSFLTEAAIETLTLQDLAPPLFTTPEIADARLSDVVLNPVKALDAASDTVGVSESVLNPAKTLSATSETETTSDGNTGTPLPNTSAIIDPRSSDVVLNPVKTLSAASETLGFSEISLAPLKTLATESATVGLSVSVLNPAKTLPTTSEGTTLSTANFPAPLLTESAIAEARFSGTPLNPVKSLDAISEMVGVSVRLLNPVKSLLVTADNAAVSETNFPADLFMLSVMPARFSCTPLIPLMTLDAMSEMVGVSVRLLNPVKSLLVTADSAAVSETNFPADLFMLSVTSPAMLSVILLNPVKTLAIASDIVGISASALNPVKSLTMASERGGVSEFVLNPWKSLVLESETVGLSPGGALNPWKNFPCESETVGFSGSEYENANPGVPTSLAELTVVSRTICPEAPATVTWSQYSTTRNWMSLNGPIVPVT